MIYSVIFSTEFMLLLQVSFPQLGNRSLSCNQISIKPTSCENHSSHLRYIASFSVLCVFFLTSQSELSRIRDLAEKLDLFLVKLKKIAIEVSLINLLCKESCVKLSTSLSRKKGQEPITYFGYFNTR